MSYIDIINDDLLTTDIQYIAHQCNCCSTRSAHLAKNVFQKFPYADAYSKRKCPDKMGTIQVCGNGDDKRYVINMFGQYFPGEVKYLNGTRDNYKLRENAFKNCLSHITKIDGLKEIAFPYKIGCGAAGGNWEKYLNMIEEFANEVLFYTDVYVLKKE